MSSISIRLHLPNHETTIATVRSDDTISVLNKYVSGGSPKKIIYKNCLIMTSFSFSFFGIQDGDDLYVVEYPMAMKKDVKDKSQKYLKNRSIRDIFRCDRKPATFSNNFTTRLAKLETSNFQQTESPSQTDKFAGFGEFHLEFQSEFHSSNENFLFDKSIIKELARITDLSNLQKDMMKTKDEEKITSGLASFHPIKNNSENNENMKREIVSMRPSTVALPQFW
ncbi:hypothetical protein TRFO_15785 [Tritrichomonas foetus]|uniref:Ubiquitin-like domain-containing protein n=1 Tax=Tritrichomonas foetus TaxID=1144522 RepID=A0A1J4KS29_9EUKA|nr:hypothetical protein TRFO_15785 [Tritrichomonas foetus]|eukprot:OHT13906.1 hypothetical protein TRFO_15785 [Tritrichomonas foetus]